MVGQPDVIGAARAGWQPFQLVINPVLNTYPSGPESRRMLRVTSCIMKYRTAMWASAGFLLAPFAIAGRHHAMCLYEVLAANAVSYALAGLIVENVRHQFHHAKKFKTAHHHALHIALSRINRESK